MFTVLCVFGVRVLRVLHVLVLAVLVLMLPRVVFNVRAMLRRTLRRAETTASRSVTSIVYDTPKRPKRTV